MDIIMDHNNFKKDYDTRIDKKHIRTDEEIIKYSKSKLISKNTRGTYTICDIHRMIYKLIDEENDKEEIKYLLEEAFVIAKKMDAKLRMYKFDYEESWYEEVKENHDKWKEELKK
jgi:predicted MPP superfamily phosphohydrolase